MAVHTIDKIWMWVQTVCVDLPECLHAVCCTNRDVTHKTLLLIHCASVGPNNKKIRIQSVARTTMRLKEVMIIFITKLVLPTESPHSIDNKIDLSTEILSVISVSAIGI
jgi:hypothetical protein